MAEPVVASPNSAPSQAMRVLVLQGGGALGSYQAGAYHALCHHDFEPAWVAGISIGAVNSAIIAGNPPEARVARLKEFWEMATAPVGWRPPFIGFVCGQSRTAFNEAPRGLVAAVRGTR